MNRFWANQKLWTRIGVIASAIWLIIISVVSRDFEWFPNSYSNEFKSELHFGPAFIVAAVGVALIVAVCAGGAMDHCIHRHFRIAVPVNGRLR
jgi:hypothetical protein